MGKVFRARAKPPIVVIHGGAGPAGTMELLERRRTALGKILRELWPAVVEGKSAVEAATLLVGRLEADTLFNAGLGAVLQSDGLARLSASLMDGDRQKFSGVQLATHLIHPSSLAFELQSRRESVVGPLGAQLLARELGIPPQSPVTLERVRQWLGWIENHLPAAPKASGTVGAVVLDRDGRLAAATSTGGGSVNFPERISDSATVAGNYASAWAAVSCTGIGEEIVDDAVAARLETRVRDGRSMVAAADLVYREAEAQRRAYGWIGIDWKGDWVSYWTTEAMPAAAMSGDLDAPLLGVD